MANDARPTDDTVSGNDAHRRDARAHGVRRGDAERSRRGLARDGSSRARDAPRRGDALSPGHGRDREDRGHRQRARPGCAARRRLDGRRRLRPARVLDERRGTRMGHHQRPHRAGHDDDHQHARSLRVPHRQRERAIRRLGHRRGDGARDEARRAVDAPPLRVARARGLRAASRAPPRRRRRAVHRARRGRGARAGLRFRAHRDARHRAASRAHSRRGGTDAAHPRGARQAHRGRRHAPQRQQRLHHRALVRA